MERPNRFIIIAELNGEQVTCHCPNTGRMKELLIPGVDIVLEKSKNPNRKTKYSVVAVYKGDLIVPITSARANDVARELIIPKLYPGCSIKSEVTYNNSRFDFMLEGGNKRRYIEVKSCTLFDNDWAIFPDAPTTRGVKHMNELEEAVNNGSDATVLLVVFNHRSRKFSPNNITDPNFATTMKRISDKVDIIPFKVKVEKDGKVLISDDNNVLPVIYRGELW